MQLATRQGGFEHVASVHGPLGLASADHGVQFVNEDDRHALVFGQCVEYRLQAFFELAAKFGPRQQGRHVERQHAFAAQRIGHFARHNALGQTFNNGGFANAGLADQDRVVFGAPLQHLDGAADFIVAANHRVQLAQAGPLCQIDAVFFQDFPLPFGVDRIHVLTAPHRLNGGLQTLA